MVSFKRLGVSCGVQSIVFFGQTSRNCIRTLLRTTCGCSPSCLLFQSQCLEPFSWQMFGCTLTSSWARSSLLPGMSWSRTRQQLKQGDARSWLARCGIYTATVSLCLFGSVFGFHQDLWAHMSAMFDPLSNFPKCNFSWFFQCAWLTSWGLTSHHPRVSELKALLLPSPASRVSSESGVT